MAEDANYLRCEHGWKRDAWPADRDRCPHCTGTGEAPDISHRLAMAAQLPVSSYQSPYGPSNGVDIHPAGHCADCRRDSVLTIAAARPNATHRMPEHEREYGG